MAGTFADKKLQQIAEESSISAAVIDWIKSEGIDSIKRMALAASKEDDVHDSFTQQMISANVEGVKKLGAQAAIKEFRVLCRQNLRR